MIHGYHFWGMHLLWWLFWIICLFIIFGWYGPARKRKAKKDSPLEILQRRFASGEITKEDYEEKKKILQSDSGK